MPSFTPVLGFLNVKLNPISFGESAALYNFRFNWINNVGSVQKQVFVVERNETKLFLQVLALDDARRPRAVRPSVQTPVIHAIPSYLDTTPFASRVVSSDKPFAQRIPHYFYDFVRQGSNAYANHHLPSATDVLLMTLEAEQPPIVE